MATRYFTPKLFEFLRGLAEHNDREWFHAHRDDYERHVRVPALAFIADLADPLHRLSPHYMAIAKKAGGSLYRIQRDARFTTDKSPYRINTGMQFRHARAAEVTAPTLFVSLQPGHCYMAVGTWRPPTPAAYEIRAAIAEDPDGWTKAVRPSAFTDVFTLVSDSLVRPPKGYADDHPLLDDLRRKDFAASTSLTQKLVTSSDFLDVFIDHARRASPFMEFLCGAAGLPF